MNPIRRILSRRTTVDPRHAYNVAALRIQLLVAMAAVDDRMQMSEVELLADSVPGPPMTPEDQARLQRLLRVLLDAPPRLEDVIGRIAEHAPRRAVADQLARELVHLAGIDGTIDDREEELLRMICGAMKIEPLTMRRHISRERPLTPREQLRLDGLLADTAVGSTPDAVVA